MICECCESKCESPTVHHIIPRKRGGTDKENTVIIPKKLHNKWHTLFKEMTPDEAKQFIDELMVHGKHLNNKKLIELYRKFHV